MPINKVRDTVVEIAVDVSLADIIKVSIDSSSVSHAMIDRPRSQ